MTINQDGQRYKISQEFNNPEDTHAMVFNHITENAVVLDIGCACGDLGVALKDVKNCQMYGLEYVAESVKIAMETGAYKEVHQFNLDELTEADFPDYQGKFDYIVCGDVLEHLRYPMDILKILKRYLKKGGYIVASIPNVAHMSVKSNLLVNDFTYTPVGLLDETHIHLFTYKSIAEGLSTLNLRINNCQFTMQPQNGLQPHDPYPLLPEDIKAFLFYDWHSYVCQYVMKISVSDDNNENLLVHNLAQLDIGERNAPDYIKNYRKQLLSEISFMNPTTNSMQQNINQLYHSINDLQNLINEKNDQLLKVSARRDKLRKKYKKYRRRATVLAIIVALTLIVGIVCLGTMS